LGFLPPESVNDIDFCVCHFRALLVFSGILGQQAAGHAGAFAHSITL
jgi:hypothetical protein